MAFTKINAAGIGSTELVTLHSLEVLNNATVGGVLTYEDVTNVDSIGIITARAGVLVGSGITLSKDGDIFATGVTTTGSLVSNGAISGTTGTFSGAVSGTTGTFSGDVDIADKIVHTGDTDTAIRFSGADTITAETGGSERVRIASDGKIGIGGATTPEEVLDLGNNVQINLKVGGRAYLGQGYSTAATILGHSVKAKTTGTVSGGMEVTETNSGGGAPSAIRMQSGNIEFHTAASGTSGATFDSEKLRITSGGNIGIGENSPSNLLHVKVSDTGVAPHSSAQIVLERSGTNYLQFLTAADGTSGILFGDANDNDVGQIKYDHNVPAMQFNIEGSERARIDSSGNLQVVRNVSIDNNGELAVFEDDTSLAYTNSAKISLDFASNVARIRSSGNGSFTSRPLAFFITNDEKVRITSTGVGIGGITPSNALDVQGGTTNTAIVARSSDSTAQVSFVDSSTTGVGSVAVGAEGDNFIIRSGSGGTERLRINGDGNVMILGKNATADYNSAATKCPLYLKVFTNMTAVNTGEGDTSDGLFRIEDSQTVDGRYCGIELRGKRGGDIRILNHDRASNSSDLVIAQYSADTDTGLQEKIRLSSYYDSVQIAGKNGATINSNLGDNVQKTDIYITTKSEMTNATMNAGGELAGVIRFHEVGTNHNMYHGIELRNKNSGDVRILNQATNAGNFANMVFVTDDGSNTTQRLIINGNGNIGAPSGNNIYNASDERLKENIVELTDGLNKINQIKPVSFTWKEGWDPDLDGLTQYGFGAHQVKSVDEILVESFGERDINLNGETIDNPLRVNEKHVIPLLVKAIQELSAKVAALEG